MSQRLRIGALAVALSVLAAMPIGASARTSARAATAPVAIAGKISMLGASSESANTLLDSGTFRGTPLGSGTTYQTYQLFPGRGVARVTFSMTNDQGTASGVAYAKYTTTNVALVFTGAGQFTGGTGAYAGMTSGILQFNAVHSKTGQREEFNLVGSASDWGGRGQQQLGAYRASIGVPDRAVLNVSGGTTMVGRPGKNRFADAGFLSGNPGGQVNSVDTFTSKTTSTTEFTITASGGDIAGAIVATRVTKGPRMVFEGYGMITSATGDHADKVGDLVHYRAIYVGGIGTVSYVGSSPSPSRRSTVALIRRFATSHGATVPPSLRS